MLQQDKSQLGDLNLTLPATLSMVIEGWLRKEVHNDTQLLLEECAAHVHMLMNYMCQRRMSDGFL